jgi:hypothetical protein
MRHADDCWWLVGIRLCRHLEDRVPRIQTLSQDKEQDMRPRAATQTVVLDHTSLHRWTPESCCHVSRGPGSHLLAELSSDGATCFSAPDLASLSRWAPALPRGPVLTSLRGELWCCHILHVP